MASIATTRNIDTTNGPVVATSNRQSNSVILSANASYRTIKVGPFSLWTSLGTSLADTAMGRIREQASNPDFALVMAKVDQRSLETRLGTRLQLGLGGFQANVAVDWLYQLGEDPRVDRSVELGNARWTVSGVALSWHGVCLGAQIGAQLSRNLSLFGSYQYSHYGKGNRVNNASGGVQLSF